MKKEVEKSVCVLRDMKHEETTKAELEKARQSLQTCLEIWNGLQLTTCTDIVSLVTNAEKSYSDAVNKAVEVPIQPGAKYQISKDIYIKSLSIPVPLLLYNAARECRKQPHCTSANLWQVIDNKVELIESEANFLIDSQSIYVTTDEQKKLAEDILKFIELINMFAEKFPSDFLLQTPSANNFFGNGKFHITQRSYPGPYSLEIIPSKLREWLQG